MNHPQQESLVLHYYGEGNSTTIASHLAQCEACAKEYELIRRSLMAVEEVPVPALPEDYGQKVWASIAPRIREQKASATKKWAWLTPQRWASLAAVATIALIAFFAGALWRGTPRKDPVTPVAVNNAIDKKARERLLMSAVNDHLERSQIMLTEVVHAKDVGSIDVAAEQRRADDLLAENRIYRQTAEKSGDAATAALLEQLERTLVEIANSPNELSTADLERLRNQIEAQDLLFKVRVLKNKVYERTLPPPPDSVKTQRL
jgi:hypothetical protein